jgi:drug/metabolite transporter (DMT)-like permease
MGHSFGLSASGLLMQWGLTIGMQLEKGGRGSQMIYVQLVFALILEWMVWGDLPTGLSLFGILLIISSVTAVNVFKETQSEEQRPLLSHEEAP